MTKAIYAGSFDPFTNGHLSILLKSSKIFDNTSILIANNPNKKRQWTAEEMVKSIQLMIKRNYPDLNCHVDYTDGSVADYCASHGSRFLIRGLRNNMDFMYEEEIAKINNEIDPSLETIYLRASNDVISSNMVRQFLALNKPILRYVPEEIYDLITKNQ